MNDDPEFDAEAMEEVEGMLQKAASQRATILRGIDEIDPDLDEQRFVQRFEAMLNQQSRAVQSRAVQSRRTPWFRVAVAALVMIGFSVWFASVPADRSPLDGNDGSRTLSSGSFACVRPVGEVAEFAPFEWTYPPGNDVVFDLLVYNMEDDDLLDDDPTVEVHAIEATRWNPTPEQQALFGAHIYWEITVRDSSGGQVEFTSGEASLLR